MVKAEVAPGPGCAGSLPFGDNQHDLTGWGTAQLDPVRPSPPEDFRFHARAHAGVTTGGSRVPYGVQFQRFHQATHSPTCAATTGRAA